MTISALTRPWEAMSYGFLDASAKRELRRKMLKAIAVPGCQMPYASREVPMARGWGTGGLQVTLTLLKPSSVVKVIDQGADDSVNAASIRSFLSKVSGAAETWDTTKATILQSRHRIPEERLRADQVLVLDRGHVAATGKPEQVLSDGILSRAYQIPIQVEKSNKTLHIHPK